MSFPRTCSTSDQASNVWQYLAVLLWFKAKFTCKFLLGVLVGLLTVRVGRPLYSYWVASTWPWCESLCLVLLYFVLLCIVADVTRRSVLSCGEQRGREWILGKEEEGKELGGVREEFKKNKELLRSLTKSLSYISKEHWLCFPPGISVLSSIKMIFWASHSISTIPLKKASGPYPSLYSSWHPTAEFNDFLSEKFKWSLNLLRSSISQWPSSHIQLLQMFLFFPFLLRERWTISANILGAHHIFKVILEEKSNTARQGCSSKFSCVLCRFNLSSQDPSLRGRSGKKRKAFAPTEDHFT